MKRFLILVVLLLNLTNTASAQQPSCSGHYFFPKLDIDDKYYAFGNYAKNASDDTCRLVSGEGVQLNFVFSKTGNTVTFRKERRGQTAETIFFMDVLPAPALPEWALDLANTNRNMMKEYVPKAAAELEQRAAKKQKDVDAENTKIAQSKATIDKLAQEKRQAQDASDTAKLRADIANMNPGQLFAKADELSSQGDTTKARETLRTLVSRFPNHPLAATAAQQMATMSSASASASSANSGSNNNASASSGGRNVSENMGDVCNGQVPAFVEQKWARFSDPALRKMYAETAKPFEQKLREDTRTATRAQVTQEVKAVLANFRSQVSVAVDNYCKMQAGCSDPKPIESSWPAALASSMPKVNGQSTSEVMASQYVMLAFGIDYFSAYDKYLTCPSR